MKRTPIKRKNRVRLATLREKQYGLSFGYASWICSHPCSVPSCKRGPGWTIPAHAGKTRGAGGTWRDLIPLCWVCENEFHAMGRFSFDRKYEIRCKDIATEMVARWAADHPEGVTGTDWEGASG